MPTISVLDTNLFGVILNGRVLNNSNNLWATKHDDSMLESKDEVLFGTVESTRETLSGAQEARVMYVPWC